VLIINIDAFNKRANNVIHQMSEKLGGHLPIEFIQQTAPIVIMDEPQNMESVNAKTAIASLNPLCTLRYSATHRNVYNLLYRLDPVRAYDMGLVKRIEVDSILEDENFNKPYIHVKSIKATTTKITAKLIIDQQQKGGPVRKTVSISQPGANLFELSKQHGQYNGYVVEVIDNADQFIRFHNGVQVDAGATYGGHGNDVMRVQIRQTIREHFEKELAIRHRMPAERCIKVLSLLFIDRVKHYAEADGKIRRWFVEEYQRLIAEPRYKTLDPPPVADVHNGYFACTKGEPKDTRGNTQADDEAYALIMRDKERLLSMDEPLKFIFSHSALREGWDNPNVFQICTLNESKSEIKKRQEIGRGLRLPIMADGVRCFDRNINRLTVVANESYDDFARRLQNEIAEECGVDFGDRIKNKNQRKAIRLKKGWHLNADFQELWKRIKHKTRYSVHFSTAELVAEAACAIKDLPPMEPAQLRITRSELEMDDEGLSTRMKSASQLTTEEVRYPIPDLLTYLQRETELPRGVLVGILDASGKLGEIAVNPQTFLDQSAKATNHCMKDMIVDGIKYERIAGEEYEMLLFKDEEIMAYLSNTLEVARSIYDAIEFDSQVERRFAEELDARDDIKLFVKLPRWFKVTTPVGEYNPDWAIVKQPEGQDAKLYLVRETKGTAEPDELRSKEWAKIKCGKAHFDALEVDFKHVRTASEI